MKNEWGPELMPAVRRTLPASESASTARAYCYFCGEQTTIASHNDLLEDSGRITLYCTNDRCEAREVIVIAKRDGTSAHLRADVRILEALDEGTSHLEPDPQPTWTPSDLERRRVGPQDTLRRRRHQEDVVVAARGLDPTLAIPEDPSQEDQWENK